MRDTRNDMEYVVRGFFEFLEGFRHVLGRNESNSIIYGKLSSKKTCLIGN